MSTQDQLPKLDGRSWALQIPGAEGIWEWHHFDLVPAMSRQWIENNPDLPPFARQLLTGTDESMRIVAEADVVAGVLPGYARTGDANTFEVTHWHFAMTPRLLVTGRRQSTRTLVFLWEALQRGARPASPAALIDLAVAEFCREVRNRLAQLAEELDTVEDRLTEARQGSDLMDLGTRLGATRREATRLKRELAPLRRLMEEEPETLPDWAVFPEAGAGHRALHGALDDFAALYDRARSLQDELTTRLAEETNRRLYIVSIVTTLFMPATFVTGFFGMNTGGLPWSGEGAFAGTEYALGLCIGAVLATFYLLWRKKLL
jgi:zinc transporter